MHTLDLNTKNRIEKMRELWLKDLYSTYIETSWQVKLLQNEKTSKFLSCATSAGFNCILNNY